MLFLLFHLGQDCYALDAGQVVEVLPLLELRAIPQAPRSVAGIFNCRGALVPVIDLSELTLGQPAPRRMSTRIILVRYADKGGDPRLLGLLAERATEVLKRDPKDFVDSGIMNREAPYLGPVLLGERSLVQRMEVNALLPASVRDLLFQQPGETP